MTEMTCALCDQPIRFRHIYQVATRAALVGEGNDAVVVPGETVYVHVGQCPTNVEMVDGRVLMNGFDIGPIERYQPQTCCKGGPQWGHDWDCPTLP